MDVVDLEMKPNSTWKDDIHLALEKLGRPSTTSEIFDAVQDIRVAAGRPLTKHSRHGVRRILMEHFVITARPHDAATHSSGPYFWLPQRR